jgi:hypothetical protein
VFVGETGIWGCMGQNDQDVLTTWCVEVEDRLRQGTLEVRPPTRARASVPTPTHLRSSRMSDQFDISLEDGELLNEVELTASLIVAASEADGPLSQEEIDRILGVTPASEQPSEPDDTVPDVTG